MQNLDGKRVLITGAGGGIGRALAKEFAAAGATLALTDINKVRLDETADIIGGAVAKAHACDIANSEAVDALALDCIEAIKGVDILVNNAAVGVYGTAWEFPLELWKWIIDINLMGFVHTIRAIVPHMIAQGTPAHIVNVSSGAGLIGVPTMTAYSASKHAIIGLSDSMRADFQAAQLPITVSVVSPGSVDTIESSRPTTLAAIERVKDPALAERMRAAVAAAHASVNGPVSSTPQDVAAQILDGVRKNRFWIMTPPEVINAAGVRYEEMKSDAAR